MIAAFFIGFALAYLGSMPIAGPIAAVVLARGLDDKPRSGFFIASGAALAECVYGGLAFLGITAALQRFPVLLPASRLLACLILTGLGAYFLFRPPRAQSAEVPEAVRSSKKSDIGNAIVGFGITALNPTLIVTWTAAVGAVHTTGLLRVRELDALPFGAGVGAGVIAWFSTLLVFIGRFRRRLRPAGVHVTVKVMGAALLVGGVAYGVRTVLTWGALP